MPNESGATRRVANSLPSAAIKEVSRVGYFNAGSGFLPTGTPSPRTLCWVALLYFNLSLRLSLRLGLGLILGLRLAFYHARASVR